jgi:hypothetical protein
MAPQVALMIKAISDAQSVLAAYVAEAAYSAA